MTYSSTWTLRLVEDFEEPGWLYVPARLDTTGRQQWVEAAIDRLASLIGVQRWDGTPTTSHHLRELLEYGLEAEPTVASLATFQVWPLPGPAAVMCRVTVVPSDLLPDWREVVGGVVHSVESAHLGVGVQFSTRTTVTDDAGSVDVEAVSLVFDAGEEAVVFSLEQSVPALIVHALPGLAALTDVVRVERPDGSLLVGVPPEGILDGDSWELTGS